MQLFSADAKIFFDKNKIKIYPPKHKKKLSLKVAHNPTRPRVFSPASIWLCGMRQFYSLKLSHL